MTRVTGPHLCVCSHGSFVIFSQAVPCYERLIIGHWMTLSRSHLSAYLVYLSRLLPPWALWRRGARKNYNLPIWGLLAKLLSIHMLTILHLIPCPLCNVTSYLCSFRISFLIISPQFTEIVLSNFSYLYLFAFPSKKLASVFFFKMDDLINA